VPELPEPRPAVDDGPAHDGTITVACREFVELVTEHLEGTLPENVERAVAAHLELCEPCVIYLEQMRSTARMLNGLRGPALPPPARARLLEVFSALHGAGRDGPRP
jgi:hypothetical protein